MIKGICQIRSFRFHDFRTTFKEYEFPPDETFSFEWDGVNDFANVMVSGAAQSVLAHWLEILNEDGNWVPLRINPQIDHVERDFTDPINLITKTDL